MPFRTPIFNRLDMYPTNRPVTSRRTTFHQPTHLVPSQASDKPPCRMLYFVESATER